jgi:hypothetical protein
LLLPAPIGEIPGRSESGGEAVVDPDPLPRSHPYVIISVFVNGIDVIMGKGNGVVELVSKDVEFITVVAAEAIVGAEPHEPVMVLEDAAHGIVGQALFDAYVRNRRISHGRQPAQKKTEKEVNPIYDVRAAGSHSHGFDQM